MLPTFVSCHVGQRGAAFLTYEATMPGTWREVK
jgi:hypothetical protein